VIFVSTALYGNQRRVTLGTLALPMRPAALAVYPVSSFQSIYPLINGRAKVRRARNTWRNSRGRTKVTGKVSYVSADRLIDRGSNLPYYSVIIRADADYVEAAGSELKLQAGMPAEVNIDGSAQTPLQYLTVPITSTMRKAGRHM